MKLIALLLALSACTTGYNVHFCPPEDCYAIYYDAVSSSDAKCAIYSADKKFIELFSSDNLILHQKKSSKLMHNKFCILNKTIVLTGSFNPKPTDDNNNIIFVHSERLAENYLKQFEYLKTRQQRKKISHKVGEIENYFCPMDNCADEIISELKNAKKSIYFVSYSFTDFAISSQLLKSEVHVLGIFDKSQLSRHSEYDLLRYQNLRVISINDMHSKYFVIDNKTVITGSFNPTSNGNFRNDENILIIHDEKVARAYAHNFMTNFK